MSSHFDHMKVNSVLWDSHRELEKQLTNSSTSVVGSDEKISVMCPLSSGVEPASKIVPSDWFLFPSIHTLVWPIAILGRADLSN